MSTLDALTVIDEGPAIDVSVDLRGDPFAEWIAPLPCVSFREHSGWLHQSCDGLTYLVSDSNWLTKTTAEQSDGGIAGWGGLSIYAPPGMSAAVLHQPGGTGSVQAPTPGTSVTPFPVLPGTVFPGVPGTPAIIIDPVAPIPLPAGFGLLLIGLAILSLWRRA